MFYSIPSIPMYSSHIVNHSKASAFNKFKRFLYKYYPRFSKINRTGEYLNQLLVLLHKIEPFLYIAKP